MKRIAIFGNAGGGKSTLASQLARETGLPLVSLDKMKYQVGGKEIPHEEYLQAHSELITQNCWIIDGFGCVPSAWQRFSRADTLVYIDLPILQHGYWVTKRMLKGFFVNPEGWPENSPIIRSSINSYKALWLCHRRLTPKYRDLVFQAKSTQSVFHLKSSSDIENFIRTIG